MTLNHQYEVCISVNNTTHSEIKVNLLFMIFYLRCKSETGLDNSGLQVQTRPLYTINILTGCSTSTAPSKRHQLTFILLKAETGELNSI